MNTYQSVRVAQQPGVVFLQIYRPAANNSIDITLIKELMSIFILLEGDPEVKVIVLEGLPDNFCTGMDLKAYNESGADALNNEDPNGYYELLQQLALSSKVIISKVEGKVNAGGVGLVAASDIVIADEKATFGLSEALFGLLPACVLPFLIRRIGYQKALWLTLSTQAISASRAQQIGLVDEMTVNVKDEVRKKLLRLTRLQTSTIKNLKSYMADLWIIDDHTQQLAVTKITSVMRDPVVQSNIRNFVQNGKFPWDK